MGFKWKHISDMHYEDPRETQTLLGYTYIFPFHCHQISLG